MTIQTGILTSRRAPKRQYRAEAGTGRRRGPGSGKELVTRTVHIKGESPIVTYSIGADADLSGLLVLHEPSPATALDASESSVHLGLELAETTVGGVNGLGQSTGRGLTTAGTLGGKVLPEESVVEVATAVEVDSGLQSDLSSDVALSLGLLQLLKGVVVAGHVGVVVVLVVNLHDLAGDGGLKGAIVVLF